jgi:Matrixin
MRGAPRLRWFIVPLGMLLATTMQAPAAMGANYPASVISAGGISVVVPGPGRAVWAAALQSDGHWRTVGVKVGPDGRVSIVTSFPIVNGSGPPGQGREDPCSDGAYSLYSTTWSSTNDWKFNVSTTPDEVGQDAATGAVKDSAKNITQVDNNCGLGDNVSATQLYEGTTTKSANIGSDSSCLSKDGTSVVSFGNLASSDLAMTCWWTVGNDTVEADIKLNKTEYSWVVNIGSNCSTKFSVEAVATHEFGHAFGLGHVTEGSHSALTMSPVISTCQNSEATLGLGDVKGLEAQY